MIAEAPCHSSSFVHAGEQDSVKERYSTETFFLDTCDVGFGVFANRDIAPGESILRFWGPVIDFAETKRRGPKECMAVQVGYNRYLDTQPPGVFVNHSCNPNAGIRDDQRLVAVREILRGEEIRFDYSTTMEEQSFTMRCLCGEPECRGVIGDFSLLPESVKARYLAQRTVMGFIRDRHLRASTVDLAAGCVCAGAR